jgi:hypothetical protein
MSIRDCYTVESLEMALKKAVKSVGISCELPREGLSCPIPGLYPSDSFEVCNGDPVPCKRARARTCKRKIRVASRPGAASCSTLRVRYTVSDIDYSGFVEAADSALEVLFNRKYISRDDLVPRKIQFPFP